MSYATCRKMIPGSTNKENLLSRTDSSRPNKLYMFLSLKLLIPGPDTLLPSN